MRNEQAITPPDVYVMDTKTAKGRGVFAARAFKKGELIEAAPILLVDHPFTALPNELKFVAFGWSFFPDKPNAVALVLGYGSLYNHSSPANLWYHADESFSHMRYVAVRDIAIDEELTINYNLNDDQGGGSDTEGRWFKDRGLVEI
ncbi:SET domain-containing protein-lysine N-methyltransferase [Chitinibacter sp. GC72]|uniref:SET domain-containing protein-lysine N-methyltransferase n=1 Tax=Chitinibacter sp. GC72 TaxID=1526917 RepID=UPI0012FA163A|nr:SET domain-containing protein-lysine N-methyltransferase [Chitinibacter sp. GC72]